MDATSPSPGVLTDDPVPLLELPVRTRHARAAIDTLERLARRSGVVGRVRGFVQPPRAMAQDLVHLALLAFAWALGPFAGAVAALLASAVGLSALARRWGLPTLVPGPPGELGWNLVLAGRTARTRTLVAGAMDLGARPSGEVEAVAGIAAGVALGALGVLSPWLVAVGWALGVAWVLTGAWRRPRVDLARVARVAIDVAAMGRPDVAVVLSSGGAESAAGAWSFLDWWALGPPTRVVWLGDPWAVKDLRRRGFEVQVVPPLMPAVISALEVG